MPAVGITGPEAEAAVVAARLDPVFRARLGWRCAVSGDGPQLEYAGFVVRTPALATPVHRERLALRWFDGWGPERWVVAELDTGSVPHHRRRVVQQAQLAPAAAALGLPHCGLLVRRGEASVRAVSNVDALVATALPMLEAGEPVILECDPRPHVNPWRLAAIEHTARLLVERIAVECPVPEWEGAMAEVGCGI
ncbi:MAG TPA: hypothetical protein VFT41_02165 [Gemmatimonadaceae bacterium]|nr:hypothetical protein [Gemmatimonadaceae bacterium]